MRNDTLANWESSSVIPKKGELCLALKPDGSFIMKAGDGVHTWNQLPFVKTEAQDFEGNVTKTNLIDSMNEFDLVIDNGDSTK